MIRQMPKRFSSQWRKLWYSGAIPQDVVFFDNLANLCEMRKEETFWYYASIDTKRVRKGLRLDDWCRGLLDLCAVARSNLYLSEKKYVEFTTQLFGKSVFEADKAWTK